MSVKVHFRLAARDGQFPVEYWLDNISSLVDYYLERPRLSCCDFQGGYCIDVADKRWNGDGDGYEFDEPWMTLSWLRGLTLILSSDATTANISFWEQSNATVKYISADIFEIEDMAAHSGGGTCAPVWVDANEFVKQIIASTRNYLQLVYRIEEELLRRGADIEKEKKEKIIRELSGSQFFQQLEELDEAAKTEIRKNT